MSGASVSDVNDRLSALELRVQQQEDELTVMKAALADVLRRLAASEVSAAAASKKQAGGKGESSDEATDWPVVAASYCTHSSAAPCRWVPLLHCQRRDVRAEERERVDLRHQEGDCGFSCQEVQTHVDTPALC